MEYFDIMGTPIKLSTIKSFRLVQSEYVYRPCYTVQIDKGILGLSKGQKKYVFHHMEPYAAIISEKGFSSATEKYETKTLLESMGKDTFNAVGIVADRMRHKKLKAKKYVLKNTAGRIFSSYLDEIPVLAMDETTGKATDVYKYDPEYALLLGDNPTPAINMVYALKISTKEEEFLFFGNGIQLEDVGREYERLKLVMEEYSVQKKDGMKLNVPKKTVTLPKINIPLLGKKNGSRNSEQVLAELKRQYSAGELTEDEYRVALDSVLEKL